jgi:hypothetical protein
MSRKSNPESVVREIRRKARRRYSTEEKIRIGLNERGARRTSAG